MFSLNMANMIDSCKGFWTGEEAAEELEEHYLNSLNLSDGYVRNPFQVGEKWQEIQGSGNWAGLLEPELNLILRAEILRYGKLAKATYDAFDKNPNSEAVVASTPRSKSSSRIWGWITRVIKALHSKHRGCRFMKEELLEKVGLGNLGYEVTHFLYATAKLSFLRIPFFKKSRKDSNWIGFVAVCTTQQEIKRLGRRDIVVAWRGTKTNLEWIKDAQFWLKNIGVRPQNSTTGVEVEHGFDSIYNSNPDNEKRYNNKSARDQVLEAVKELVEKYKDQDTKLSITVTGHSLGSALATLCAFDIAGELERPQNASPSCRIPITVYSFAGPRVGNHAFKKRIEERGVKVLRVVNKNDVVTKVPGRIFTSYEHVGVELDILNLERSDISKLSEFKYVNMFDYMRKAHSLEGLLDLLQTKPKDLFDLVKRLFRLARAAIFCTKLRGAVVKKLFSTWQKRFRGSRGGVSNSNMSAEGRGSERNIHSPNYLLLPPRYAPEAVSPVLTPKASRRPSCPPTSRSVPLTLGLHHERVGPKRDRKITEGQESNFRSAGEVSLILNTKPANGWEDLVLNTEPASGKEDHLETVWQKENGRRSKKKNGRGADSKKVKMGSTASKLAQLRRNGVMTGGTSDRKARINRQKNSRREEKSHPHELEDSQDDSEGEPRSEYNIFIDNKYELLNSLEQKHKHLYLT